MSIIWAIVFILRNVIRIIYITKWKETESKQKREQNECCVVHKCVILLHFIGILTEIAHKLLQNKSYFIDLLLWIQNWVVRYSWTCCFSCWWIEHTICMLNCCENHRETINKWKTFCYLCTSNLSINEFTIMKLYNENNLILHLTKWNQMDFILFAISVIVCVVTYKHTYCNRLISLKANCVILLKFVFFIFCHFTVITLH